MKKSITIVVSLVSAVIFSTASFAGSDRPEISTDLIYGNSQVKSSLGQAYVNNGPVQQEGSSDALHNSGFGDASPSQPWNSQLSSRPEISTDMLYGS